MTALPYPTVDIHPERARSVRHGHPWIFSGAIVGKTTAGDGDPVLLRCQGEILGTGIYHGQTDIAVRLLTRQARLFDAPFFIERFTALKARKEPWLPPQTNAYRIAFGEADGLPGLVLDRYDRVIVMQAQSAAMEKLREPILAAMQAVFAPEAIVERSDVRARRQEPGSPQGQNALVFGTLPAEVVFQENGLNFIADVLQGQKTGFFLDQRENRQALRRWVQGRRMLNTFCYSGGFSVACARDAASITNVDISRRALDVAQRNYALNELPMQESDFIAVDAFDYLKSIDKDRFDAILVDPPAFAKNRGQVKQAIKAYISLNTLALRKLPPGGVLATSSCTAHVDNLTFIKILNQSAIEAGVSVSVLDCREQPFDHAYNLAFPEGRYLKFFVLQKGAPF